MFRGHIYISVYINQTCPPGFKILESKTSCVWQAHLGMYLPNFTTAIRDHTNVERVIMSQLRLRMVRPWPDQPDRFRRLCSLGVKTYTLPNNCTITNRVGQITRESGQQFWVGLILHPLCPYNYCVNHEVTFPLKDSNKQCMYSRSGIWCGACKGYMYRHISTLKVYQQLPSCSFLCSDGNSPDCLAPSLQIDSGNMQDAQWPIVLCQYCWSQSYHLSTSRIYWCFFSLHCLAKPWHRYWNIFLWWNDCLQ